MATEKPRGLIMSFPQRQLLEGFRVHRFLESSSKFARYFCGRVPWLVVKTQTFHFRPNYNHEELLRLSFTLVFCFEGNFRTTCEAFLEMLCTINHFSQKSGNYCVLIRRFSRRSTTFPHPSPLPPHPHLDTQFQYWSKHVFQICCQAKFQ